MADISGYTSFLAESELEHAQDVLRDLMHTVVGKLRPALHLAKLEGDAAFCYLVTDRLDGSLLLDTLEAAYFAFRRRLEGIGRATTCKCNACVLIPALNLKFIAHHGSFVRQRMFGTDELTGTDVIVAHRLLKNGVVERLGLSAYVLLTDASLAAAALRPEPLGLVEQTESYVGLGEVRCWVHDLEPRWAREQELRRVRVSESETLASVDGNVAASPQALWAIVTDPARRPDFISGVTRVDETPLNGRRGVGTQNHCMHGDDATLEEVLDWRPFDYFTMRTVVPGLAKWVVMQEFVPTDAGTRLTIRIQRPTSAKDRATLEAQREMLVDKYRAGLNRLASLVTAVAT